MTQSQKRALKKIAKDLKAVRTIYPRKLLYALYFQRWICSLFSEVDIVEPAICVRNHIFSLVPKSWASNLSPTSISNPWMMTWWVEESRSSWECVLLFCVTLMFASISLSTLCREAAFDGDHCIPKSSSSTDESHAFYRAA